MSSSTKAVRAKRPIPSSPASQTAVPAKRVIWEPDTDRIWTIPVVVKASKLEKEMITTDRAELEAILKERQREKTHSA